MPPPEGAGERPVGVARPRRTRHRDARRAGGRPGTHASSRPGCSTRCAPPTGQASAWPMRSRAGSKALLGSHGLIVFDSADQAVKPLVVGGVPPRARHARAHGSARHHRRRRDGRARTCTAGGAAARQPLALPHRSGNGARTPIRCQGDKFVAGETTLSARGSRERARHRRPTGSARTCCSARSSRTRSSRRSVTWPDQASSPTSGSFAGSTSTSACPMPLVYPRATATLVDSATIRFLNKYDVPLEDLQPQDEAALEPPAAVAAAADRRAAFSAAGQAMSETMQGVVDALPSVDPTLAGAAKNTLRQDGARAAGAAGQDDSGGQAPRRHAAPPVHARAGPDVPAGPPAGAVAGGRLLPQPVRPRARRPAARGTADRSWAALGVSLSESVAARGFGARGLPGLAMHACSRRSVGSWLQRSRLPQLALRAAQALDSRLQPTVVLGQAQP